MLGTRGVRLGLVHPEMYEMQARAIFRAARAVRERRGRAPRVEMMILPVAYAPEFELARNRVLRVGVEEGFAIGRDFGIGTMIELPRACFAAGDIRRATVWSSHPCSYRRRLAARFGCDRRIPPSSRASSRTACPSPTICVRLSTGCSLRERSRLRSPS